MCIRDRLDIHTYDASGHEIKDFSDMILYNADGTELKEWQAITRYILDMGKVNGVSEKMCIRDRDIGVITYN